MCLFLQLQNVLKRESKRENEIEKERESNKEEEERESNTLNSKVIQN